MKNSTSLSKLGFCCFTILASFFFACSKEKNDAGAISLLSITANSINLVNGTINVPSDVTIELTFSAALDIPKFEAAFSLTAASGAVSPGFSYANASSKALVALSQLTPNTQYSLKLNRTAIGLNGEVLDQNISINFTTADGGIITEMAPCISATNACLETAVLTNGTGTDFNFDFYSSYPIFLENARWEKLKNVVIVTHGQNRDADNYYAIMMTTLRNENLDGNTILIAPFFKNNADAQAGDLYWSDNGWREGQNANTASAGISAFAVIDAILARLADKTHFPVLKNVVVTGHSSGALFTHAYAAANKSEPLYPDLDFTYVIANSQYFYYPDDVRYDENSGQFVVPTGCVAFNHWPLGFVNPPPYLTGVTEATVDQQIVGRKITYLLGTSDTVAGGTLNTTDCEAVLLGANRFKRGEHIFSLLETNYPGVHNSQKVLVPGVGHDAQGMYQSAVFRGLLGGLLE
ncbi:MAG: Ig-like domain-containing protein [Saprospiraceae bacterium]|nr:Ig-like domain-containing protein [Saprospiraceae bacterium]